VHEPGRQGCTEGARTLSPTSNRGGFVDAVLAVIVYSRLLAARKAKTIGTSRAI
jgi:hypothetical protein